MLEVYTDGASRGNPGPAAIGVVVRQMDGPALCAHGEAIGQATNNVAEYRAVLAALQLCRRWNAPRVHLFVDSELVVRQLTGVYRVKSPDLQPLFQQVQHLARQLRRIPGAARPARAQRPRRPRGQSRPGRRQAGVIAGFVCDKG